MPNSLPRLTETPNPDATVPTGMCGSPTVCASCPSHFLCFMKASQEADIIRHRESSPPERAA